MLRNLYDKHSTVRTVHGKSVQVGPVRPLVNALSVPHIKTAWPTLPGSGPKLLDGNVSLKFLQTRLQSESFDTLDDLLVFQVERL